MKAPAPPPLFRRTKMSASHAPDRSETNVLAQRTGANERATRSALDAFGLIVTPDMSIAQAIGLASGTRGAGGRMLFTEGVWEFPPTGMDIEVGNLEFIALSPQRTVFRRVLRGATAVADGMVRIQGANTLIDGIAFEDPHAVAATDYCIEINDAFGTVDKCSFTGGRTAIYAHRLAFAIRDNDIDMDHQDMILLAGDAYGMVSGNRLGLNGGATPFIRASLGGPIAFLGNVLYGGTIEYYAASNSVDAANVATVSIL